MHNRTRKIGLLFAYFCIRLYSDMLKSKFDHLFYTYLMHVCTKTNGINQQVAVHV